ncbi:MULTISPECIES: hypothetical protein [Sinorhizobium]|uniref:hypothetical protein n=1 Tax=Sinorhizobium TaxID=28105 RepID=UPI000D4F6B4A|nr:MULTISPECIES: hypothetical protein [Sinorhizobium]POH31844.1 hypothetical protein ATY30_10455 [Sinorhizobium americanum]
MYLPPADDPAKAFREFGNLGAAMSLQDVLAISLFQLLERAWFANAVSRFFSQAAAASRRSNVCAWTAAPSRIIRICAVYDFCPLRGFCSPMVPMIFLHAPQL